MASQYTSWKPTYYRRWKTYEKSRNKPMEFLQIYRLCLTRGGILVISNVPLGPKSRASLDSADTWGCTSKEFLDNALSAGIFQTGEKWRKCPPRGWDAECPVSPIGPPVLQVFVYQTRQDFSSYKKKDSSGLWAFWHHGCSLLGL